MDRRTFLKVSLVASASATALGTMSQQVFAQSGKPPTIAFFVKNVTNPFWRGCRIGAEKAAKELGVSLETVAPTKPDNIEEQTRLVEDWIVKKPDAFVFVPVDYKALVPSIQKANKAGIPIIGYNNRMTDIEQVTYIGSNDEEIEYQVSTYLFKSMGGKGKIIHIDGVPAASTAQARKRGLEKALKENPGIELLASQTGQYRRLEAVKVFENLMQRYPEIDAVVCANDDMAVGVAETLAAAGRGAQDQGDRRRRHSRRDGGDRRGQDVRDRRLQRPRPGLPRRHGRRPLPEEAAGAQGDRAADHGRRQAERRRVPEDAGRACGPELGQGRRGAEELIDLSIPGGGPDAAASRTTNATGRQ